MKKKNIVSSRFLILFFLIGFFMSMGGREKVCAESTVVRVGVYEMQGFQTFDELNNLEGYNAEYLNRIGSYTGWRYEYVKLQNFNEGLKLLQEKKIDLLAPTQITEERMREYVYSEYSIGTEYYTLVTLDEKKQYSYEDFESFNGMKIAVVTDYLMTDSFISYMGENGFTAELEYYASPDKANAALDAGEVDGAVNNLMMLEDNFKVLGKFAPVSYYYITWKGNEEMMDQVNMALRDMKISNPGLENSLTEKYFPYYNEQYFTKEEQQFIDTVGTIRLGYVKEREPLSFTSEETGKLDGISRQIFDRIEQISGLKFDYVELPYGAVTYDFLRDNQVLLVSSVEYNTANLNIEGLRISTPYLSTKKVIVAKRNLVFQRDASLKVAVVTGSQTIKQVLAAEYPNFTVVDYETNEQCFEAVRKGRADILFVNQYVAENMLARPKYEDMAVIPVEGLDDNLCFSVVEFQEGAGERGDIDSAKLISVINKSISRISQDEVDTIVVDEVMKHKYTYTFWDFCIRYRYTLMLMVLAVVGAFFTVVYISNLKRKNFLLHKEEEEKLLLQQKRYELIMDKSEEIIYEISLRGDACLVSDKMREKFGWSFPDRVENPSVDNLMEIWKVHPDDREKLRTSLISMIDNNNSSESLIRMQQANGEYIWCKVARFPLLDNDNILVSIVGRIADIDDEVREKEKLQKESRTDGLTGLLNKQTFREEVSAYLKEHSSVSTGIIFMDMDHFKDVNDTLGHIVGDRAIRDVAQKLQIIFSNYDKVARFGGDEFCIFVQDIPKDTLEDKLGWAVDKLKETYTDGGQIVKITASIGAIYCNEEGVDYKTLLNLADRAVYEAKENGRNQYLLKQRG